MTAQDAGDLPVSAEVRRGAPTAEELGALIAVVTEHYARESADAVADEQPTTSAWMRTSRALRAPLRRDIGWGRFSG
ncbi:acyl-CoA carboxylase subunit epsilon [Microbacterium terricola]|uniref:Acyl-CoA carboxylase subunit epsilon n=1 Tax=Microbacterium terricola TaxID=344163 RepID=A0ABM8DWH5_9MICO|nr:acyl-CoA carboxylase subunit epsilon [Microbacterium terricola]UYK39261.1 acyl-CoA carboxylase subunit epsilon [Microbacterium terricola]BDV30018.1 hypothetical protein Microterr_06780 [Microbacterium terricola]